MKAGGCTHGQENLEHPDLGSHLEFPVLAEQTEFSGQNYPPPHTQITRRLIY